MQRRGLRGAAALPHRQFWAELRALALDGIAFTRGHRAGGAGGRQHGRSPRDAADGGAAWPPGGGPKSKSKAKSPKPKSPSSNSQARRGGDDDLEAALVVASGRPAAAEGVDAVQRRFEETRVAGELHPSQARVLVTSAPV